MFFTLGFVASFLAGIFIRNQTLIIGGSSSVYPLFTALESDLEKKDKAYQYISSGSYAGIWGVLNERLEVGFMSKEFNFKEDEEVSKTLKNKNFQLEKKEIARDGIIFVYQLPDNCSLKNKLTKNKLTNLNLKTKELKEIYSEPVFNWEDLIGVECSSLKNKIHRISRQNGSGTRSVFEKKVMNNEDVITDNTEKSSGPILKSIKNTPGQIGYVSFSYIDKIRKMHKSNPKIGILSLNGVTPSIKTIKNKEYFLFRPFIMLFLHKNEEKLQKFFNFLAQKSSKKKIENKKFIYTYEQ